ncbi:hypothetical protein BDV59DRAFT_185544 [Aspergillus ambiguus]|uniref:uncharacterized protein n=1 Tax=Aspergillus ambiguus TaxID=176160 RepID=UPI003CCDABFB
MKRPVTPDHTGKGGILLVAIMPGTLFGAVAAPGPDVLAARTRIVFLCVCVSTRTMMNHTSLPLLGSFPSCPSRIDELARVRGGGSLVAVDSVSLVAWVGLGLAKGRSMCMAFRVDKLEVRYGSYPW